MELIQQRDRPQGLLVPSGAGKWGQVGPQLLVSTSNAKTCLPQRVPVQPPPLQVLGAVPKSSPPDSLLQRSNQARPVCAAGAWGVPWPWQLSSNAGKRHKTVRLEVPTQLPCSSLSPRHLRSPQILSTRLGSLFPLLGIQMLIIACGCLAVVGLRARKGMLGRGGWKPAATPGAVV